MPFFNIKRKVKYLDNIRLPETYLVNYFYKVIKVFTKTSIYICFISPELSTLAPIENFYLDK